MTVLKRDKAIGCCYALNVAVFLAAARRLVCRLVIRSHLAVVITMLIPVSASADAQGERDIFISGYATAILVREFHANAPVVDVANGRIRLPHDFDQSQRARVRNSLSGIPGVVAVEFGDENSVSRLAAATPLHESGERLPEGLLPAGHLFKPLLADPRWPHFSAAYHSYGGDGFDGSNIGTVSFGETFPFYRGGVDWDDAFYQWEVGIQAGVFSDFNFDASSTDLINTDFIPSIYSSLRFGRFSAFARLFHQSSHLGDEFLLRTRLQRVNLSYEGADLRLSYLLPYEIRLYGGGGGLFHREPTELKPWSIQYGLEFRSPWRFSSGRIRPIAAIDLKNFEENDWNTDVSAKIGVQFESLNVLSRNLQILLEYYDGYSPSGQFYDNKIEYMGIGAHFHF